MNISNFQKIVQAARDVNDFLERDHRIRHCLLGGGSQDTVDIDSCVFFINGQELTEEEAMVEHGAFWNDLVEKILIKKVETDTFNTYDYHAIERDEECGKDSFEDAKRFFENMRVQIPATWNNPIKIV